jgi:hypothetical protein
LASIIDELMAREGSILRAFAGVNWAKAADHWWTRAEHETESGFRARVRREARRQGYRLVQIGGALATDDPIAFPPPRYTDAKED